MRQASYWCVAVWFALGSATLVGADFRVENRVFRPGSIKPVARTTTIFSAGQVYDIVGDNGEITVFEPVQKLFTLVDPARGVQTAVTTETLGVFETGLRERCQKRPEEALRFMADPRFEERFDAGRGELALGSRWLTYTARTQSADPDTVARFIEFSSWTVRLNSMLAPWRMPPFGRMVFDQALDTHDVLPTQIEMTCVVQATGETRELKLRSEHQFEFQLRPADRERIAEIDRLRATARQVGFDEFRAPEGEPRR